MQFTEVKSRAQSRCWQSYGMALLTQISNPKAAIIYGGIFAALLPAKILELLFYLLPPMVFLVEAGWYLLVAIVLISSTPRSIYLKSQRLYDRISAMMLAGIGLRLVFDYESK